MSIHHRTRQDAATAIRAKLIALAIPPPPGKRFDQMLHVSEAGGSMDEDPAQLDVLIRAEKELQELEIILDTLAAPPIRPELRRRLREVVENDPLHPMGMENSPGRDTQFELLTEAVLTRAEMKPRRPTEEGRADFTVQSSGRGYAVEAKRIKSDAGVERAFEKACGQIEATGLTGFVLMDLGPVLHVGVDAIRSPMPDAEFRALVFAELKQFFDDRLPGFRRTRNGRPVRSIQAVNWFVRRSKEQGWGLDTVHYGVPLDEYHAARRFEHLVFQDQLIRGLPGNTALVDELTAEVRRARAAGVDLTRFLPKV